MVFQLQQSQRHKFPPLFSHVPIKMAPAGRRIWYAITIFTIWISKREMHLHFATFKVHEWVCVAAQYYRLKDLFKQNHLSRAQQFEGNFCLVHSLHSYTERIWSDVCVARQIEKDERKTEYQNRLTAFCIRFIVASAWFLIGNWPHRRTHNANS